MPLSAEQRSHWRLEPDAPIGGDGPMLEHCRDCARVLVAGLRDLERIQPGDTEGLLRPVGVLAAENGGAERAES